MSRELFNTESSYILYNMKITNSYSMEGNYLRRHHQPLMPDNDALLYVAL